MDTQRLSTLVAIFVVLAAMPLVARAHGGEEHVLGTVKAADAKSITVETKDKKEVVVQLDAATKFEKGGAAATARDLAPGQRVAVHAKRAGGSLTATIVKIGSAAGGQPAHHHHDEKAGKGQ